MPFESLTALIEAQKLSSGELWYVLITFDHPTLPAPLRFASPASEEVISIGRTFLPSRFDVMIGSESFEEIPRSMLSIEATSGVVLAALRSLRTSPLITIEVVTASEPDVIQFLVTDLEIDPAVRLEGVTSMAAELVASRFNALPFPGLNMDRKRVPGIFSDTA